MDELNPLDYNISDLSNLKPTRGRILIAEPFMPDPYFKRSVVLIIDHNDDGTFGFILNKPMDLSINDTLMEFPSFDCEVHMGGPVQPENLFFLHTLNDLFGETEEISPGLFWGGDFEAMKSNVGSGTVQTNQIKFFVGYAGWGKGQLESELKEGSWLISNLSVEDIFETSSEELWQLALKKMGSKHSILANFPEDPALN